MQIRDARPIAATALPGLVFLGAALFGVALVGGSAWALNTGALPLAAAAPALAGGLLAVLNGGAGYALARQHTRMLLEREGFVEELAQEFGALRAELTALLRAQMRAEDRVRRESETFRDFVREERASGEVVARRVDVHREALEQVEARLAEIERAIGRGPKAALRVEVVERR